MVGVDCKAGKDEDCGGEAGDGGVAADEHCEEEEPWELSGRVTYTPERD